MRKTLILLLSALVQIKSEEINLVNCSNNDDSNRWWSTNNGTACFAAISSYLTYDDAENNCQEDSGHLVSIHSDNDIETVKAVIDQYYYYSDNRFWLGLRRNPEAGVKERWSDGTYVDYTRWSKTQTEPLEHCSSMKLKSSNVDEDGMWFRTNCGQQLYSICKRDKEGTVTPKPEPKPTIGQCEDGWIRRNDKCYKINPKKLNFEEASVWCRNKYQANLVAITSQNDQNFVSALLGETGQEYFWLGGYKGPSSFTYLWKSNEPFSKYDNWAPTAPGYAFESTKCIKMSLKTHHGAGLWEDEDCDKNFQSICQKSIDSKLTQPSSSEFPKPCPGHERYFQYRTNCFRIHESEYNWKDAEALCTKESGHLASFADILEQSIVQDSARRANISELWIGMKGVKHEHESFQWSDGTPLYFTNWGESGRVSVDATQCVFQNSDGEWIATEKCDNKGSFVCKLHLKHNPDERPLQVNKQCPPMNMTVEDGNPRHWIDLDSNVDFCYNLEENLQDFGSAQFNCYLSGGQLASIHSEHEMKLLTSLAARTSKDRYSRGFWLGLHRKVNGGFQWTDETPVDFLPWAVNQPSNETDFACVKAENNFDNWKAENCNNAYAYYVCAVPKVQIYPISNEYRKDHFLEHSIFVVLFLLIVVIFVGLGYSAYKYVQLRRIVKDDTGPVVNFAYLDQKYEDDV